MADMGTCERVDLSALVTEGDIGLWWKVRHKLQHPTWTDGGAKALRDYYSAEAAAGGGVHAE